LLQIAIIFSYWNSGKLTLPCNIFQ